MGFNTHDIRTAHSTLHGYYHYLDEMANETILHSAIAILNDCYLERSSLYFTLDEIAVGCLYLAIQGLLTYYSLTHSLTH